MYGPFGCGGWHYLESVLWAESDWNLISGQDPSLSTASWKDGHTIPKHGIFRQWTLEYQASFQVRCQMCIHPGRYDSKRLDRHEEILWDHRLAKNLKRVHSSIVRYEWMNEWMDGWSPGVKSLENYLTYRQDLKKMIGLKSLNVDDQNEWVMCWVLG